MANRRKEMELWRSLATLVFAVTVIVLVFIHRRERSKLRGLARQLHPVGESLDNRRIKVESPERDPLAAFPRRHRSRPVTSHSIASLTLRSPMIRMNRAS